MLNKDCLAGERRGPRTGLSRSSPLARVAQYMNPTINFPIALMRIVGHLSWWVAANSRSLSARVPAYPRRPTCHRWVGDRDRGMGSTVQFRRICEEDETEAGLSVDQDLTHSTQARDGEPQALLAINRHRAQSA